jgi:hypothetical protein
MSSVATLSKQSYQQRIQSSFDLYSGSHLGARSIIADMDKIPETYQNWLALDPQSRVPADQMIQQLMATYHTAMQTQKAGIHLLQCLREVSDICKNIRLTPSHHEINILLSQNPEYPAHIQEQGQEFIKVTQHLELLAKKTETHFLQVIKERLPTVRSSIEACLETAQPKSVGGRFLEWTGWSAPSIETAYKEWNETASEAEKNWQLDTNLPNTYQPPSAEEIKEGNGLDQALKKFNLSWIDPDTMHRHGVQPTNESNIGENLALSMLFLEGAAKNTFTTAEMEAMWLESSTKSQSDFSADPFCGNPTEMSFNSSDKVDDLLSENPILPNLVKVGTPDSPTKEPSPFLLDPEGSSSIVSHQTINPDDLKTKTETQVEKSYVVEDYTSRTLPEALGL